MEYDLAFLAKGASQMGIELNEKALSQFHRYLSMLLEWNERFNLTAITDPQEVMVHHFMDSISILKLKRVKTQDTLLDLGTGAGLPGIPIKILLPECRMTLVDSVNKKTQFLREVIRELGLEHVEVIHARAEDLGTEAMRREAFDIVVSRAVAELRVLAEYCLPFVRLGGFFISYKGPGAAEESSNAAKALEILGGQQEGIERMDIPFSNKTHQLIVVKKTKKTPKNYPRTAGKPKKSPL